MKSSERLGTPEEKEEQTSLLMDQHPQASTMETYEKSKDGKAIEASGVDEDCYKISESKKVGEEGGEVETHGFKISLQQRSLDSDATVKIHFSGKQDYPALPQDYVSISKVVEFCCSKPLHSPAKCQIPVWNTLERDSKPMEVVIFVLVGMEWKEAASSFLSNEAYVSFETMHFTPFSVGIQRLFRRSVRHHVTSLLFYNANGDMDNEVCVEEKAHIQHRITLKERADYKLSPFHVTPYRLKMGNKMVFQLQCADAQPEPPWEEKWDFILNEEFLDTKVYNRPLRFPRIPGREEVTINYTVTDKHGVDKVEAKVFKNPVERNFTGHTRGINISGSEITIVN